MNLVVTYVVMMLIVEYGYIKEKEYDIPPKAMIIDAILREVYGDSKHQ